MLARKFRRREMRPKNLGRLKMNAHAQAGEVSVTPQTRATVVDGITVKLLAGTNRGPIGTIVTLSASSATYEITKGRAEKV